MFLDMINALKASNKDTMSTKLSQALGEERKSDNIIEKSITWIETHFGQTPVERTDKAMEALQTIRRETGEDITEFIQRFEGVMEQLRLVRFELEPRLEAALLHRAANLSKPEANNISSQVDMGSSDPSIVSKLKAALRKVGFCKDAETKEDVVLQCDQDNDEDSEDEEDAYYGEFYGNQRQERRRFRNQGDNHQQNQSRNQSRNQSGSGHGNQSGQRQNFSQGNQFKNQGYSKPSLNQPSRALSAGMVEVLDNLPANQQLQICGIIVKACSTPSNLLALPAPQTDTVKQVFQCGEIVEEEVLIATALEKVFLGGIGDCTHIILDTGSS
jgi:hypothetical protein